MALYAKVSSYPPLEQLSILPRDTKEVNFTVVFEWSKALPDLPWTVVLRCKSADAAATAAKWTEFELERSTSKFMHLNGNVVPANPIYDDFRASYTITLPVGKKELSGRVLFTVKFRSHPTFPWQWVETQYGTQHGELVVQKPLSAEVDLLSLLKFESGWNFQRLSGVARNAAVFSLESDNSIPRGEGVDSKMETKALGIVLNQLRYFATVRIHDCWLGPRHGKDKFFIPEGAVMCCFLMESGQTLTLLAVNGVNNVLMLLQSNDEHQVVAAARNDGNEDSPFRLVAAVALNFEESIAAAVSAVREVVSGSTEVKEATSRLANTLKQDSVDLETTPFPLDDWYDGLGYCTYNSLGVNLTTDRIMTGLDSLAENDINVSTLIMDDMWQTLKKTEGDGIERMNRAWEEFEANEKCFPGGLKVAVSQIREKYPGIKNIAVWHALFGYWGGMSPTGALGKEYKMMEMNATLIDLKRMQVHAVGAEDIHRMYDDFYAFLASCGITGVKTDVQYFLDQIAETTARASLTNAYQSAWTSAYLRHFKGRAISCMSMIPQILYHSFLPTNKPRILLRNSDDFFPEISNSHTLHLFTNAHNALFTQHLNALPDWDMFQTSHPYAGYHAAARCISGGPLYITDSPNEHNLTIIKEMSALNQHGRTIALRPTSLGRTINAYDGFNDGKFLKIGSYTGAAGKGTAILGLFNIAEKEVTALIPVTDFPGIEGQKGKVLIRSHKNAQIFPPVDLSKPIGPESLILSKLEIRSYNILSAHPIQTVELGSSSVSVVVLGLVGKMTGAAAVLSSSIAAAENGTQLRINVTLKALGVLGIWLSGIADASATEKVSASLQGKAVPQSSIVRLAKKIGGDKEEDKVLEIDIQKTWTELGLQAAEGEDVSVEVVIG